MNASVATAGLAIQASALTKKFGSVHAVAGIDLEVPKGCVFGLIGANGAGKTTFIKILLGITYPDGGAVHVLGGDPNDAHVRKKIGYLPERLAIPEAFSARRFLWSVGRMKGMSPAEIEAETPRLLERVGLEPAAWKRKTGGYSKGMKQRTGLAAALLGKPQLLVLDEPTDGIDPLGRARIREVILEEVQTGATVFLNSHLLTESERLCDHVAVLAAGKVVKAGALDVLKRRDAVRVQFQKRDGDIALAAAHGFVHVEELDDTRVFRIEAQGGERAVSDAVQKALADGLVLVELSRELKDLETILKESIGVSAPASGGAS
jgi:ABC-2 type transport system ATP-binding protein